MTFYETLSSYYDRLFPMETEILDFLRERLGNRERILDIACGTGTYARGLADAGYSVTAVDADAAMIQKAKQSSQGSSVLFLEGRMEELPRGVDGTFDAAYCIGNSLPHLTEVSMVRRFFSGVASLLAPRGRLIVQTVNFDRIPAQGIFQLPSLSGGEVSMKRLYKRTEDPNTILFETEITVGHGAQAQTISQAVPLRVSKKEELVAFAGEADFVGREVCGSYSGEFYEPSESFLTILTADRKD
jgi:2-polyprenyl-3-methyl-5-hydroxy-6-metoxy-1,4-benzoquinol methylase